MKPLKHPPQQLVLYKTLFVHLPFPGHSQIETVSAPFWRLMAEDCIVLFDTQYTHMDTAFALMKAWNLRYVNVVKLHPRLSHTPVLVACRGAAEMIWDLSPTVFQNTKSVISVANHLWGTPKLAINVTEKTHHSSAFADWSFVPATGNKKIDPYYYPLRKNGLEIDESMTDVVASLRHEWTNVRLSKWKMVERFAILLVNSRGNKEECVNLLHQVTDGKLTILVIRRYVQLVADIHRGKVTVDYTKNVEDYLYRYTLSRRTYANKRNARLGTQRSTDSQSDA